MSLLQPIFSAHQGAEMLCLCACVRVCVCCVGGCGWSENCISVSAQIDYQTDSIPALLRNQKNRKSRRSECFTRWEFTVWGRIKSEGVKVIYFKGIVTHIVHLYMHGHTKRDRLMICCHPEVQLLLEHPHYFVVCVDL